MRLSGPPLRIAITVLALVLYAVASNCSPGDRAQEKGSETEILVAAASDLAPAFEEIGKLFEAETGIKATFSFGSTGTLARQIENGAPVDLFAAANVAFIEELERKGLILPDTKALYARGRITLWTRADRPAIKSIEELAGPLVTRVAIANPDHAPYGAAARQALMSAGVWGAVEPKLVLGENIRQAQQFAETGNVEAAITALSLSVQSKGNWTLIPEGLHSPLDQALAVIKRDANQQAARRFAAFINGPQGRDVMRRYGFILPGEELAH